MNEIPHVESISPLASRASSDAELGGTSRNPLESDVDFTRPRRMRVCFPVLLDGDLVISPEHVGVSYLVSTLRRFQIACEIVEVPANGVDDEAAIARIMSLEPDLVGLSLTTVSVRHATAFGATLRKCLDPSVPILAGGPLASALGSRLLGNPNWQFLDALVRGEGEVSLLRYVEALWCRSGYYSVPGLSWRGPGGRLVDNPVARGVVDMDLLPEAARDQYGLSAEEYQAGMRISTSRGCSGRCTFCNAPHARNRVNGGKLWRTFSTRRILDEIERLHRDCRIDTFEFVDSTFEDPGGGSLGKRRVGEIAQGILDRGLRIQYSCCMQARNWHEADRPLLELLYLSGLEKVLIGIESGSQAGLGIWQKKSTVEDNVRAIGLLREAGIHVEFGFIAFHPWSTFAEIRENNSFLHRFYGHHLRRYSTPLELYPGAEVIDLLRVQGLLDAGFDLTLDTFAYHFRDPRVGVLARCMPLLFDDLVASAEGVRSPVLDFERSDLSLTLTLSRFRRRLVSAADLDAWKSLEARVGAWRAALSEFNFELMSRLTTLAEQGELDEADVLAWRPEVDARYRSNLTAAKALESEVVSSPCMTSMHNPSTSSGRVRDAFA
jgi:radical SAM superfamily enzyme YgiQ (UPF0313 family)